MKIICRVVSMFAAFLIDLVVLVRCRPHPYQLTVQLQHPREWIEAVGSDAAALELTRLAIWLAALWLTVGLGAAVLSAAPGRGGRCARLVARRTLPAFLRRVIVGTIGLGIVLAPASAGASPTAAPPTVTSTIGPTAGPTASSPTPSAPAGPEIGWPTDGGGPPVDIPWPTTPAPPVPVPSESIPTPVPTPTPNPLPTPLPGPTAGAGQTTVGAGDSLWVIAARRLGPTATPAQVAAAWPAWYAANHNVIGDDPSLVHPGQVLVIPTSKGSTP